MSIPIPIFIPTQPADPPVYEDDDKHELGQLEDLPLHLHLLHSSSDQATLQFSDNQNLDTTSTSSNFMDTGTSTTCTRSILVLLQDEEEPSQLTLPVVLTPEQQQHPAFTHHPAFFHHPAFTHQSQNQNQNQKQANANTHTTQTDQKEQPTPDFGTQKHLAYPAQRQSIYRQPQEHKHKHKQILVQPVPESASGGQHQCNVHVHVPVDEKQKQSEAQHHHHPRHPASSPPSSPQKPSASSSSASNNQSSADTSTTKTKKPHCSNVHSHKKATLRLASAHKELEAEFDRPLDLEGNIMENNMKEVRDAHGRKLVTRKEKRMQLEEIQKQNTRYRRCFAALFVVVVATILVVALVTHFKQRT